MMSIENFYFETPLYRNIIAHKDFNPNEVFQDGASFHFYSLELKENTTYIVSPLFNNYNSFWAFEQHGGGFFDVHLTCVRKNTYLKFFYYYNPVSKSLIKVGQLPSLADLHISKIKNYDKVLSKEKLKEFTKAIGLAANGVGIGSFVYLRRIFEELIDEAYQIAKTATGWNDESFKQSRMSEKIGLLKSQLPQFLVENKELYSILSIGIHSLKEDDCLAYFETVKLGIEMILEEKNEMLNKHKRLLEAKSKINQLNSNLSKGAKQ